MQPADPHRHAHRPNWHRANPGNKRWWCERFGRRFRDQRLAQLAQLDRQRELTDHERREQRTLHQLQAEDRIDPYCLPAWAERAFTWPWHRAPAATAP